MLCAPVFIFMAAQLSEGAHVVVYQSDHRYVPYSIHFSEFVFFFSPENGQNTKILEACHFRMIQKWPRYWARNALILRELL